MFHHFFPDWGETPTGQPLEPTLAPIRPPLSTRKESPKQRVRGQVPQHPERSKRSTVATATTSRTLMPYMCPTSHRIGWGTDPHQIIRGTAWRGFDALSP